MRYYEVPRGTIRGTIRRTTRYYEVLRGTTRYYEVLRGTTRYYGVLRGTIRRTTRYYEVLRGTTRYYEVPGGSLGGSLGVPMGSGAGPGFETGEGSQSTVFLRKWFKKGGFRTFCRHRPATICGTHLGVFFNPTRTLQCTTVREIIPNEILWDPHFPLDFGEKVFASKIMKTCF